VRRCDVPRGLRRSELYEPDRDFALDLYTEPATLFAAQFKSPLVLLLLFGMKTQIFKQECLSLFHLTSDLLSFRANTVRGESHVLTARQLFIEQHSQPHSLACIATPVRASTTWTPDSVG